MGVVEIKTVEEFNTIEKKVGILVSHFRASWAPQCQQITDVLTELSTQADTKNVVYANIAAEELSDISLRMKIKAVPTVIITKTLKDGDAPTVMGRIDGAKPVELASLVRQIALKSSLTDGFSSAPAKAASSPEDLNKRLKALINSAPCMLFMKGNPENPKCGFSRTTVELLGKHNAQYSTFDILTDNEVRQGLKTYSDWPTYPQLYIKGELVGGLDILKEMDAAGDLASQLPTKQNLNDRLKALINTAPLMVFMKGDKDAPRCGFSRTLMEILKELGLEFSTFDILSDEEVRQGLKKYSDWPTYPQVYVKGELVGGLDIIKEMKEDGSLLQTLKGE